MKFKRVLRFYFSAGILNEFLDAKILAAACDCTADANESYDKIICLIGEKQVLGQYFAYLDGVIKKLSVTERSALREYAASRTVISDPVKRREIKRAVMKLTRKGARLYAFGEALTLIGRYYCLLTCRDGNTFSCP